MYCLAYRIDLVFKSCYFLSFIVKYKRKGRKNKMYTIEEFDKEKTKIVKYVLYQKRTEQEIRKKFSSAIDKEMLEDIIEYLKEAKYINDEEFIEKTVANFMLLKNLSMKEIQYKLMAKGLDKKVIEQYMFEHREELEQYEIQSAKNILDKKLLAMDLLQIKQYLLRKGYKIEAINQVRDNN